MMGIHAMYEAEEYSLRIALGDMFLFFLDDHPGLTLFGTVFWVTTGEKSSKTILEEL
jgi:hypothetical protein